jgi:hypothetical protein
MTYVPLLVVSAITAPKMMWYWMVKCLNFSVISVLRLRRFAFCELQGTSSQGETLGHFAIWGMWHSGTYPRGWDVDKIT